VIRRLKEYGSCCLMAVSIMVSWLAVPVPSGMCLHHSDYVLGWPLSIGVIAISQRDGRATLEIVRFGCDVSVLPLLLCCFMGLLSAIAFWRWTGKRTTFPAPIIRPAGIVLATAAVGIWTIRVGLFASLWIMLSLEPSTAGMVYRFVAMFWKIWAVIILASGGLWLFIDARRYSLRWQIVAFLIGGFTSWVLFFAEATEAFWAAYGG